jgi:hypothetical protein
VVESIEVFYPAAAVPWLKTKSRLPNTCWFLCANLLFDVHGPWGVMVLVEVKLSAPIVVGGTFPCI